MRVRAEILARHVRESNLIEGIRARPGRPLYDSHLLAAKLAAKGRVVHPNDLHALLGRSVRGLRRHAGTYRMCGMEIGGHRAPDWRLVPVLMEKWLTLVEQYVSSTSDLAEKAHLLHAWLLCIHPYEDGNGRTARLVWNMLRVHKGLPWHIEYASIKHIYYARVRAIEKVFKENYPKVY